MDDLHYCQEHMNVPDDSPLGNAVGMQIGELDWLSELHRLLHES